MIKFLSKFCQRLKTAEAAPRGAAAAQPRRPPAAGRTPDGTGKSRGPDRAGESLILSERLQIERKQFSFELKENASGRFLRITEDVGGRRDTIIVPATGLPDFRDAVDRASSAGAAGGKV